jgi:hypothetical protein
MMTVHPLDEALYQHTRDMLSQGHDLCPEYSNWYSEKGEELTLPEPERAGVKGMTGGWVKGSSRNGCMCKAHDCGEVHLVL